MKNAFTLHHLQNNRRFKTRGTRNGAGFTLIEFIVVLGILGLILTTSVYAFSFFSKKSEIDASRNNIVSTLNIAKNRTLASEQANQYGIYFDTSTTPDRYILFQGPSYSLRNIAFDEIHNFPSAIEISSVSFNVPGNEVVFSRLTGNTENYGIIVIYSTKIDDTRDIYIYSSGEIGFQPESVPGAGRIIDSRHTHFDLGWDISGSTVLKFDFVNAGKVEQVLMADYLSLADFDWQGQFSVNNVIQKFRVHTHQLTPDTMLCIHRDRDEGINNEEVYIYIIQGGTEKEIAHYDNDQNATVYKGIYVWNQMQSQ